MKKLMLGHGLLIMCLLVVVGLSWPKTARAVDQALIEGAKKEGKFVWYCSWPIEQAVAVLDAFKEKYPFMDTSTYFRSNSFNVYTRLNTEMSAGQYLCDSVGLPVISMYNEWKKKGWILKYDSPVYNELPKEAADRPYWISLKITGLTPAYCTDALKGKEIPTSWGDLTDPKWKDALGVEDIDSGAQQMVYDTIRGVMGRDYWPKVGLNRPKIYPGTGAMINGLLRNEIKVAIMSYSYVVYTYREIRKAPIQGIWPKEGVPMMLSPCPVMANAPHPNAAKLFLEWGASKEAQERIVQIVGGESARKDVAPPKGNLTMSEFKQLYVGDWDKFAAETPAWQEFWKGITRK